jgi:hypothetical protein
MQNNNLLMLKTIKKMERKQFINLKLSDVFEKLNHLSELKIVANIPKEYKLFSETI